MITAEHQVSEDYQVKLNDISKKIGILVTRYNELKQKFESLEEENGGLKERLKDAQSKNQALTNELRTTKLVKAFVPGEDGERTELKRKLNEYIKEIDRCVAMLND